MNPNSRVLIEAAAEEGRKSHGRECSVGRERGREGGGEGGRERGMEREAK